jgi:hypothetical protein
VKDDPRPLTGCSLPTPGADVKDRWPGGACALLKLRQINRLRGGAQAPYPRSLGNPAGFVGSFWKIYIFYPKGVILCLKLAV